MTAEHALNTTAEIFENLSIEDYHARKDVLSKSMLSEFMDCPARFKYLYLDGGQQEDNDSLRLGTAVHTLALEPEKFAERHYLLPATYIDEKTGEEKPMRRDPRMKVYKDHIAAAGDRTILTADQQTQIKGMAESLKSNKKALALLQAKGKIESSIFWTDPETGLRLRCRPDFLRDDGLIVDLKTSHSANPELFQKTAYNMNYDVSAALTTEGYYALHGKMPENYVFLVIEPEPPYLVEAYDSFRPFEDDLTFLLVGQKRLKETLNKFVICKKTNKWPGYSDGIIPLGIPNYHRKNFRQESA